MSQDKYEIVKMAREAGLWVTGFPTEHIEHFAALCRAPLVAENEGLKESLESVLSQLKERDAELARVRAGEPVAYIAWKDGKPCYEGDDAICEDAVWPVDSDNDRTSMPVFTAPQPAAQEPTSAVPVVEQLVEALEKHHAEATRYSTAKNRANATCAEFKTSPLSELAEQGYMLSLGKETVAAIAAGQKFIKENGK